MESLEIIELAAQRLELFGYDDVGKIVILREHTATWVMEHTQEQINDWYDGFTQN